MDKKHNFLSFVALGSFNPAILTPSFLEEQNIFETSESPEGQTSPVVSEVKYKNITFFAELERFQVMHKEIRDFLDSPIIEASSKYMETLKHTPILVVGVNFNITISQYQNDSTINKIFNDPTTGLEETTESTSDYQIELKARVSNSVKETLAVTYKYFLEKGISRQFSFSKKGEEILFNFNQEVRGIDADRSRKNIIHSSYSEIVDKYNAFVDSLNA